MLASYNNEGLVSGGNLESMQGYRHVAAEVRKAVVFALVEIHLIAPQVIAPHLRLLLTRSWKILSKLKLLLKTVPYLGVSWSYCKYTSRKLRQDNGTSVNNAQSIALLFLQEKLAGGVAKEDAI